MRRLVIFICPDCDKVHILHCEGELEYSVARLLMRLTGMSYDVIKWRDNAHNVD